MSVALPDERSILHRRFLHSTVELIGPVAAPAFSPTASIAEALTTLKDSPLGCVVITDQGKLLGIFTERDLLIKCAGLPEFPAQRPLEEFMTKDPQSIRPSASVARLLHLMSVGGFRHVPVVGPRAGQLRIVSSKHFVDFIYKSVTKKIAAGPDDCVLDDNQVDKVFTKPVSFLKPTKPVLVKPTEAIAGVVAMLISGKIGSVVVCDNQSHALGIFTERDYLCKIAVNSALDPYMAPVSQFMTTEPRTVPAATSVAELFNLMSEGGYRHLPVVDSKGAVTGMISVKTFIDFFTSSILGELHAA